MDNFETKKVVETVNYAKVAVFIDNENLFYGSLHNARSYPNYKRIMEHARTFGKVVHAIAVCDWIWMQDGVRFVMGAGIEPRYSCNSATTNNGNTKAKRHSCVDSQIHVEVYEAITRDPEIEVIVLVAGSRDYVPLVHSLKRQGKYVVVVSEKSSTSWELSCVADEVSTMQDLGALNPVSEKEISNRVDGRDMKEDYCRATTIKNRQVESGRELAEEGEDHL